MLSLSAARRLVWEGYPAGAGLEKEVESTHFQKPENLQERLGEIRSNTFSSTQPTFVNSTIEELDKAQKTLEELLKVDKGEINAKLNDVPQKYQRVLFWGVACQAMLNGSAEREENWENYIRNNPEILLAPQAKKVIYKDGASLADQLSNW